jgi:hypothetical protein
MARVVEGTPSTVLTWLREASAHLQPFPRSCCGDVPGQQRPQQLTVCQASHYCCVPPASVCQPLAESGLTHGPGSATRGDPGRRP